MPACNKTNSSDRQWLVSIEITAVKQLVAVVVVVIVIVVVVRQQLHRIVASLTYVICNFYAVS